MEHVVGIGEYAISCCPLDTIKTFALSSCVAVTVYDPINTAAGMVHIALPSPSNFQSGIMFPHRYATTALPLLLNNMSNILKCSYGNFELKLFGGANSIRNGDVFNIGHKNIEAVIRTLESLNLRCRYADLGGKISRTIEMEVGSGYINVITQPINI